MDNQSIADIIRQTVEAMSPVPPNIVTAGARRAVERRLYDLPRLCEKVERVSDQETAEIAREIDSIKRALQSISRDTYYSLIPAKYFQGAKERTAAALCACDKAAVWRNRARLLDVLALSMFGVEAWDRTRSW